MSDSVKVRADALQTGDRLKLGPKRFTVVSAETIPYENYPQFFVKVRLAETSTLYVVHKYQLVTIMEGSNHHGTTH